MLAVSGYHERVQDLGKRLKAVREAHDLQQMEIARKVVTSKRAAKSFSNYLSRIERGDETNPSLNILEQIAAGLGLTLSAFFLQLEQSQNSSLIGLAKTGKDPAGPVDDAHAVSSPLVISADGLLHLGRVIGRAIRDAARDQQAATPRRRQS